MVDMELMKIEIERLRFTKYELFSPSIRNLEKLFRKYEVSEYAEFYYNGEWYGKNQKCIVWQINTFSEGQRGRSQTDIDRTVWNILHVMRCYPRAERWYLCYQKQKCSIYIYGRDIPDENFRDFWIIFRPRRKGLHMKWHRRDRGLHG